MSIISGLFGKLGGGLVKEIGDVADKFITTDEERIRLKTEIEKIVQTHMESMESLRVQDVTSARNRELGLRNSIGIWVQNIAAAALIIAFFIVLYLILSNQVTIQDGMRDIAIMMLGHLSSKWSSIYDYWFGSSQSSKAKDDVIQKTLTGK